MSNERPILFSAPMVRAILAGAKTQTRRVVKPALAEREWIEKRADGGFWRCADGEPTCYTGVWETHEYAQQYPIRCPYGQPGDRLWVRETFGHFERNDQLKPGAKIFYRADGEAPAVEPWRPSIHMPRWASRITLDITGVRVERLNEISPADAVKEGIETCEYSGEWLNYRNVASPSLTPQGSFRTLWESINGEDSWGANPWVWVVEFKRVS